MLLKTAMQIILHEKEKSLRAVIGVTLALFLVLLQSGFYLGYKRDITVPNMIQFADRVLRLEKGKIHA